MLVKRLMDLILVIPLIIILAPFLVILGASVLLCLGSPIIFRQKRPGLNGKIFYMYKFRTMTDKRDSSGNLLPDKDRITRLGKFLRKTSIDELPELANVLKGDMSLVGPRPLLVQYLPLYTPEQMRRHDVKPGITGFAQINGRNAISWEEKFRLDVWYVDNRNLLLDIKILLMTIVKVLKREGISQEGQVTVEPFKGSNRGDIH